MSALALAPLVAGAVALADATPVAAAQGQFFASGNKSLTFTDDSGSSITCTVDWAAERNPNEPDPDYAIASLEVRGGAGCIEDNFALVSIRHIQDREEIVSSYGYGVDELNVIVNPVGTAGSFGFHVQFFNCGPGVCSIDVDFTAPK
jgi:hypothetical protein